MKKITISRLDDYEFAYEGTRIMCDYWADKLGLEDEATVTVSAEPFENALPLKFQKYGEDADDERPITYGDLEIEDSYPAMQMYLEEITGKVQETYWVRLG